MVSERGLKFSRPWSLLALSFLLPSVKFMKINGAWMIV